MSSVRLRWIIGLMGISLIALIAFQWQWITTAVKTNQDQFQQNVMESMINVVRKLERREVIQAFNKQMLHQGAGSVYASQQSSLSFYSGNTDSTISQGGLDLSFEIDPSGQISYSVKGLPPASSYAEQERNEFLVDSIIREGFRSDQVGNDAALKQTLERMNNKSNLLITMMEELMYTTPMHLRLPDYLLDSMLSAELSERGISIPYEYGVWESAPITWISGKTRNRQRDIIQSEFSVSLFPNDFFGTDKRLSLIFPTKDRFLAGKLWFNMASSGFLLLIIFFLFGYSIYTIFKQKKLSKIKTDFINNMTHEFKTPIATIGLAVEALQDAALSTIPNIRERYIGMIGEENKRLGNQVEKVLQMAVVEKKELKLELEKANLHELIETAISKISLQLESRNGKVNLVLDAENPQLLLDKVQIMHVLLNLFDNAIKYSEDEPNILVRTQSYGNKVIVSIKDHGIGMTKEAQRNVFQSFYRVSTGNLHDVKGFGLGLAFVKSIIEEHNGTITVDSELGVGTKFTFTLPSEL